MSSVPEPIAVIGSGCRFPGDSNSPSKLWELLQDPRDPLTPVPKDRFSGDGFYHEDSKYHGHGNARHACFLAGDGTHRRFDARFFGINASEASVLDPQMRLLLETIYEALEAGGQTMEGLQGSDTAVYAGTMLAEYERLMLRDEDTIGLYHGTGTTRALVANRVSYFFDWHGPSLTLDTACSSSLVAVHQAAQQLRTGQSRVAVAAGANLILDPYNFATFSNLNMLSPDGRSRMWDDDVQGYGRGEGVAAVVLKTLSAAVADGDHIECVIREVGANQDGKTPGLTMPSASAQAALIRDCYSRAGLDLTNPDHRPQFFEAHGTGTPVGDPIEAEAIASAFFPAGGEKLDKLYVGSIKSVIGHTEGTAGLAALLKASLAVQHATIPPNLNFRRLNPKVEPFYAHLRVPISPLAWPSSAMRVRRASVNSFGFGGTNCHAIVESYTPPPHPPGDPKETAAGRGNSGVFTPFVLSAASRTALVSYLTIFCKHLQTSSDTINPKDLAYTLHSRRSRLQFSTAVAASSIADLSVKIEDKLKLNDSSLGMRPLLLHEPARPRILGVFTGQGAQWARMGVDLAEKSATCRRVIQALDGRLARLPVADRPSWSLLHELQKDASSSRISQAEFSQPLCTAVQILQVNMLRAAGIEFTAVVGHSSGEIGAAYAVGAISAEDAICIAYYRGMYSHLAKGTKEAQGAMMAVESSIDDIQELCESRHFRGRVSIAAVNSPASLTVSGDRDAVERMQLILEDENKFARLLKVDKAYHSHHMLACSDKYLAALAALNIPARLPQQDQKCAWFSSVHASSNDLLASPHHLDALQSGKYWNDNLTQPVLFMQAIQSAWAANGPFDLAIEVGPHPALKIPALQTVQQMVSDQNSALPYTSLLRRDRPSSIESVADALGYIWSLLGMGHVKLAGYDAFMSGNTAAAPKLVKGLPSYAWDHDTEYWHESRYAKADRFRPGPVHPLLGHTTPDSTPQIARWRNILRPREIPWLRGHRLEEQTVFPAAGYVVLALEAALRVCKRHRAEEVTLVEVLDVELGKALTFDDQRDDAGVEAVFTLSDVGFADSAMTARFTYNAAAAVVPKGIGCLPVRGARPAKSLLLKVPADDFYDSLERLSYQYSGPFKALSSLERRLGFATGSILNLEKMADLLVHPAVLDTAFQATMLARAAPFDGAIWALHVPRAIKSVRFDPALLRQAADGQDTSAFEFDAVQPVGLNVMSGDVDVYLPLNSGAAPQQQEQQTAMIQVQGLKCVPFAAQSAKDDNEMFTTTVWDVASPDAVRASSDFTQASAEQHALAELLDRASLFFLRNLDRQVPADHPARAKGSPLACLFGWATHCLATTTKGPFWRSEWHHDTRERIARACAPYAHVPDVRLLCAIGDNFVAIATGERQAIEVGMQDGLLAQYYQASLGMETYTRVLARVVRQVAHRFPHANVLEVGAGTGGATKAILREIGGAYRSYTFTDVSAGFFGTAQDEFVAARQQRGMAFRVLDINKVPGAQGFQEGSYDVVVASMVLHATDVLEATLRNVRRLLRPGGYLVMLEGLPDTSLRLNAIFGAFPGWWAGEADRRVLSPLVDVAAWDSLLRRTGFGGCDTSTPIVAPHVTPMFVLAAQAVDQRVAMLRDPLGAGKGAGAGAGSDSKLLEDLIIITGEGKGDPPINKLACHAKELLAPFCVGHVAIVASWADLDAYDMVSDRSTVLALSDLVEPFFKNGPSEAAWDNLRSTLQRARTLLWVTHARRSDNPYANMTVGLLRSAPQDIPTLDVQFLDFPSAGAVDARVVAETLLRLRATTMWQREGGDVHLFTTTEPEIVLDEHGQALIPRMVASRELNDRYNSSRRNICKTLSLESSESTVVAVAKNLDTGRYLLTPKPAAPETRRGGLVLRISHSLAKAVRVSESGLLFLALGQHESGDQAVFLSAGLASSAAAWNGFSVSTDIEPGREAEFLSHVSRQLVACNILRDLGRGDTVLVLGGDAELAAVIGWRARNVGVRVVFATQDVECCSNPTWLRVHPSAAERDIRAVLPRGVAVFVDLAGEGSDGRLRALLPPLCRIESWSTLFRAQSMAPWASGTTQVNTRLQDAVNYAHYSLSETEVETRPSPVVSLGGLVEDQSGALAAGSVIDWTAISEVTVKVQPADTQVAFDGYKTYWLAGLSHGLGLSLCEWMVRHGARHVVISSRRPAVDAGWLASMAAAGATVRVFSCDVTRGDDVVKTHAAILASGMPPFGGVAQGAMVLDDVALADMTLDRLLRVTRPKVDGSIHLDRIFHGDRALDFFVFFSSVSAVLGNSGQANYHAANMFLTALASQRARRGLAASVINIGPVLGVGYIAQSDHLDIRRHYGYGQAKMLSETDLHQQFAEAVLAGRRRQPHASNMEITTGLATAGLHDAVQPFWAANPIMSHLVRSSDDADTDRLALNNSNSNAPMLLPVKTRLAQAPTRAAVLAIIRDALLAKMASLYQLPIDTLAAEDPATLHLAQLGTDSLLATELRGWFLKTLQVNIPVLKILSGVTVRELLDVAFEGVPKATLSSIPPRLVVNPCPARSAMEAPTPPDDPKPHHSPEAAEPGLEEDEGDSSTSEYLDECATPMTLPDNSRGSSSSRTRTEKHLGQDAKTGPLRYENAVFGTVYYQKTAKLSFGQTMFWFVLAFLQDKSSLNHTASFRLTGQLRRDDFEQALRAVGQRHEILRACFFEQPDGQPAQGVLETSTIHGDFREIQHEDEVAQVVHELETHSFDMAHGETLKVVLLTLSPTTHFLVVASHSLVVDGTSMRICLGDLMQHYQHQVHASDAQKIPQFLDCAAKQHRTYKTGGYADELRFWRTEFPPGDFPDALPILRLGKLSTRPALTSYNNERADVRFSPPTKALIKALCRRYGVTPFHFHLAVFRAMLARHADDAQADLAIGIADANRSDAGEGEVALDRCMGNFVNLLPLRFRSTPGSARFDALLGETRAKALAGLGNSRVPFQVLLNELGAPRSPTTTPIFQCFVDYRLGQREKMDFADDGRLEMLTFQVSKLAYDVALDIIDDPDGDCLAMLTVRKDLYTRRDAERLVRSYELLVEAFVAHPDMPLDEPDIFDAAELEKAMSFSRGPSRRRTWPETMVHKIDEVMKSRAESDGLAVKWTIHEGVEKAVTYAQLRARVDAISHALLAAGIKIASRVAVLQEPTGDWIASILAVMRLGAAYLPLDQGNPWNRLAAMTRDYRPGLILLDDETEQHVDNLEAPHLERINVSRLATPKTTWTRPAVAATASTVATILYTSGSSGTPKGIVLKHEGFRNWLESTARVYDLGEDEVVLQQSSSSFDMSLIQIFTALCLGGSLYLVPRRLRGDARAISELICTQNITYTFTCTSELSTWFQYGSTAQLARSRWRRAITGGEPGVDALFKPFAALNQPELRLFHAYGPTEISWTATTMELPYRALLKDEPPSYTNNIATGHVLPNYSVYILDAHLNPVPPGVQSEIYIGGPGVAAGYLDKAALTAERFVPDIFATPEQRRRGWATLHRTGDLGRWGDSGELFLEGRIAGDTQVKIRGLRVDLREIERALLEASHGTLTEAVVSVRRRDEASDGLQFLMAHVVFSPTFTEQSEARARLVRTLPSRLGLPRYMCPAVIVPVDRLLQTSTGKLDRRGMAGLPLPESTTSFHHDHYNNSTLTKTETALRYTWEDILSENIKAVPQTPICPTTDFFMVGGTSLLLLELRRRIMARWGVDLSLVDMFRASSLGGMADLISGRVGVGRMDEVGIGVPAALDASLAESQRHATILDALSQDVLPQPALPRAESYGPGTKRSAIVLTGATGYLGRGILSALIADPAVYKIHCLAVRNSRRLQNLSPKVAVYEGDLALPDLGLSPTAAATIFASASLIIHNGADVSYLKPYPSLRKPNLLATKTLAILALPRKIPLHYVSSGGACTFAAAARPTTPIGPTSMSAFTPPKAIPLIPGYAASKWASEAFLENLKRAHPDWPVTIHRPSNISRVDEDPQLDLVFNLQRYAREMRAVPVVRGAGVSGVLDCVGLDVVVRGILSTFDTTSPEEANKEKKETVRFIHHLGGIELPMHDLRSWIRDDDTSVTGEIAEVPLAEWVCDAEGRGLHPALAAFLRTFDGRGELVFPSLVKG
ncbi:AMP-binding enzyme [Podospora didyma]|uniref:AMP-binding enzyme n=1 Tax=Podospora didyma TaxID=330526 RepID=A0AAE0N3W9_9PEZI|nr:AMP-binding enzyme [Podospora didyma]